jgi:hypothetical protein
VNEIARKLSSRALEAAVSGTHPAFNVFMRPSYSRQMASHARQSPYDDAASGIDGRIALGDGGANARAAALIMAGMGLVSLLLLAASIVLFLYGVD